MFNFLPQFSSTAFAIAGLCCAAGPIIIHLLNRRRYRILQWAAMDFLREALQRNRRIMQFRDLMLLLLRTAAVLFFGLALARPFTSSSKQEFDASQPLHAVLVVDNSASMGYESHEGTLLDRAKERAVVYLDRLPKGSRISIVPLCGSAYPVSLDPYRTKEDAIDALKKIELVDRQGSVRQAANKAQLAAQAVPQLAKRIVFLSDQQISNWRGLSSAKDAELLPDMQVVQVAPEDDAKRENTWISAVRVQDGIADVETPTTFVVELRHEGSAAREDLQVRMYVAGVEGPPKIVHLESGMGVREVIFHHTFDLVSPEPGKPVFVPVKFTIPKDRLIADDEYDLVVPVVARLPVLFIDQYSDMEEDPRKHLLGETYHLRKWLVPVVQRAGATEPLIRIRHLKFDTLSLDELQDELRVARLAVIAGVPDPGEEMVILLRDYVKQGGQLMISAGELFDPGAWNNSAYLAGNGILPLPVKPETIGTSLQKLSGDPKWFTLAYDSLQHHHYFRLAGNSEAYLRDFYSEPLFFKTVVVDDSEEVLDQLKKDQIEQLERENEFLAQSKQSSRKWAEMESQGTFTSEDLAQRKTLEQQLGEIQPTWLEWGRRQDGVLRDDRAANAAGRYREPQVLARFDDGIPFLVERKIDRGRIVFVASGPQSGWSTLSKTDTMVLFDRILRGMLESTLPKHNFLPREVISLPVPINEPGATFTLTRPGGSQQGEPLDSGFIGAQTRGVTVRNALTRGLYHITAERPTEISDGEMGLTKIWEFPLAIRGETSESELSPLTYEQFQERALGDNIRWIGPDESISLDGAQIRNQYWWIILILLVLVCLIVEMALLSQYSKRHQETSL